MNDETTAWLVAYVDINHLINVNSELLRIPGGEEIEVYIPTVKVLKKKFKNEEFFEDVPLLFNYGFFRVPRRLAANRLFLDVMKAQINCIFAWVSDVTKVLRTLPILHEGNVAYYSDAHIPVATATSAEIAALVDKARENTIFTQTEIDKIVVGSLITLRGYPWEGMDAKVLEVDERHKNVKVSILLFQQQKDVVVPFDSVFFTIYHGNNYNDDLSNHKSLDEMRENKTMDKLNINLRGNE